MAKLPKSISSLIDEITVSDYEIQKKTKPIDLGTMALYYYPNPKGAATLEVYDQLPYVFILGGNSKYVWGFNIHYLSYTQRLKFMKYLNAKRGKLTYEDIKKAFKAGQVPLGLVNYTYRLYLISHIKSHVRLFDLKDDEEFDDAYAVAKNVLPRFKGQSDSQVFKDIRTKMKASQQNKKK